MADDHVSQTRVNKPSWWWIAAEAVAVASAAVAIAAVVSPRAADRPIGEGGIQIGTLQLLGIAAFFVFVAAMLVVARWRLQRRYRQLAVEADVLRKQSEELEAYTIELDIARREAERALLLAEEKNRTRSEFVLMIDHELRTPLTAVVTGAELLKSNGALQPAEQEQLIDDIVRDGNRLNTIIAQMLAVARIESRGLDYELRAVTVSEACREIEASYSRLTVHHDAALHSEGMESARLMTDPRTLGQLVASLADNAFTHGATEVSVRCGADLGFEPMVQVGERPEHAAYFEVSDDGPGIDPESLPHAFEEFETDGLSSGTGLGLYVASLMIEAIQGSLALRTSRHGTTIAIAVPIAEAEPEKVPTTWANVDVGEA